MSMYCVPPHVSAEWDEEAVGSRCASFVRGEAHRQDFREDYGARCGGEHRFCFRGSANFCLPSGNLRLFL